MFKNSVPKIFGLIIITILSFSISSCTSNTVSPQPDYKNQNTSNNITNYISTDYKQTPPFFNNEQIINSIILNHYPQSEEINSIINTYQDKLDTENHFIWNNYQQKYCLYIKTKHNFVLPPDQPESTYQLSTKNNFLVIQNSNFDPTISTHPENSFLTIHKLDLSSIQTTDISEINILSSVDATFPLSFYYQNNQVVINQPQWKINPSHQSSNLISQKQLNFRYQYELFQSLDHILRPKFLTIEMFDPTLLSQVKLDDQNNMIIFYPDLQTAQDTFSEIITGLKIQPSYSKQTITLPDNTATEIFGSEANSKISLTTTDNTVSYFDQNNTPIFIQQDNNLIYIYSDQKPDTKDQISIIPALSLSKLIKNSDKFLLKFKSLQFQIENNVLNGYLVK